MEPFVRQDVTAAAVLGAVEAWATGMVLLREIGGLVEGRLDGLLVPVSPLAEVMSARRGDLAGYFGRAGLVGVEVKVSRSDFMKGKAEGQYERYLRSMELAGLYLAVPEGMVRPSEVPEGLGLLVVAKRRGGVRGREEGSTRSLACVCRRHPAWRKAEFSQETLWRILFRMREEEQKRERDLWRRHEERVELLKKKMGSLVGRALDKLDDAVCREAEALERERKEREHGRQERDRLGGGHDEEEQEGGEGRMERQGDVAVPGAGRIRVA